ncbi:MAG TPA: zinc-dependent metalloprotease [Niabella sp.]|nr:zinc-dependent metalloprotease [Niabella sp.]
MQRVLVVLLTVFLSAQMNNASAQRKSKKSAPPASVSAKADTTKKSPPTPPGQPKPFKEIITSKAVSSKGMFNVHKVDEKYFFEIPNEVFGRDILVVARLSKAATGFRTGASYAGDQINSNTIRFEKGPNYKIYLKRTSFQEIGRDSSEGMYRNVMNSNIQPIGASFDVKAWSADNNGAVIDITDYVNGDNDYLFFSPGIKKFLGISGIMSDRSYTQAIRTYPSNVELKTVKTYSYMPVPSPGSAPNPYATSGPLTFELNTSMVLLPKEPMQPRYFDDRVGYFTTQSITDFDVNPQGIDKYRYIARYRLEPKDQDIEKYKRGELVEPKKQIVYYIDPSTPKKWAPYLIQGVNDWQVAFEKAGFKNAIIAKMAPTFQEDSTFNLEDARHSAIIYKPSDIPNASGPNVHDPRSGEIMESHINWYHNVMSLVRNWYMIQTSAVDPKARKMEFDDELMGQLIRFVSSHEVGHTLGLRHNFGSSSTVPVEKLRDKAWVETHGHTPSIMDYARFNYVAQPEDNISEKGLFPRIGDYDIWAIEWGYRWYPQAKTADDEVALLNKITMDKLKNPRLWWGDGEGGQDDPRSQTEDLSNDAMKAGNYGIKNLKRLVVNIPQYTKQDNKDYTNLQTIYNEAIGQFSRYIGHVTRNLGGIEHTPKRVEQAGSVYQFISKEHQKEAINWLKENVFTTPFWLIQNDYPSLTGQSPLSIIYQVQSRALGGLLNANTLNKLTRFEVEDATKAYTPTQMLSDVRKAVFSELPARKPIDIYRRQLQSLFVEGMISLFAPQASGSPSSARAGGQLSERSSIVKGQLRTLLAEVKTAATVATDYATKNHLLDLQNTIKQALDPK